MNNKNLWLNTQKYSRFHSIRFASIHLSLKTNRSLDECAKSNASGENTQTIPCPLEIFKENRLLILPSLGELGP